MAAAAAGEAEDVEEAVSTAFTIDQKALSKQLAQADHDAAVELDEGLARTHATKVLQLRAAPILAQLLREEVMLFLGTGVAHEPTLHVTAFEFGIGPAGAIALASAIEQNNLTALATLECVCVRPARRPVLSAAHRCTAAPRRG